MNLEYLAFSSKRRFGVEIETNRHYTQNKLAKVVDSAIGQDRCEPAGWGYSCNNDYWSVKPDSSCGDLGNKDEDGGGYEVVSSVGYGSSHLNDIEKVTTALQTAKVEVNRFCGLHVQVEIKDFDDERAATLLALWCRIEPVIGHAVPRHRIESHHCHFHTKNKNLWTLAQRARTAKEFWSIMRLKSLGAPAKRNTMTLVNYQRTKSRADEWDFFDRPTVELRIPESSLDAYNVKNWARLFVNFVETSSRRPFPSTLKVARFDEVLEILGLKSPSAECSILSPGLFETKCWFLLRLKEYARSQQVSRVVSKYWQQIMSPAVQWHFAFPQVEQPFIQVLLPARTKNNNEASLPAPATVGAA